ncbi:MAG: mechanosensitive ion channel [Deltaproteobacteria bacterium]
MNWSETFGRSYELIQSTLVEWFEAGVKNLPNFVVAVLVLIFAFFVGKIVRNTLRKVLVRTKLPDPVARIVAGLAYVGIICVGLFIALSVMDLNKTVTSILAGAGVVGLALSFAFQDLASNFISGLFITLQRPLRVGDLVLTNSYKGHVDSIGLRSVTIRDLDGQHIIIPSKDIFQSALTNYSLDARRRVEFSVGVSYASNLQAVEDLIRSTLEELPDRMPDTAIQTDWDEFGDSSINIVAKFWVSSSEQSVYNRSKSSAMKAVKSAFDAHDITIPFPIRTLDFGIKGGQTAVEVVDHALGRMKS